MANRREIEDRILQIISYIDQEKTLQPLIWAIKLFSYEELLQLKDFLENWDYKPIYILLDSKIKEYLALMEEIKQMKIWNKMNKFKQKEFEEREEEEIGLESMLVF